jgi:ubiquinol-cytochrome c reductase cytochrome c1 subunit
LQTSLKQKLRFLSRSSLTATSEAGLSNDLFVASLVAGGFLGSLFLAENTAHAIAEENLPWPHYDWSHTGPFAAYDPAAIRRGFEVYRQVCSTCHSLEYISYRNLVGVSHTKEQAVALAGSIEVDDGPDEKGDMFKRPGILNDHMPRPYPNNNFARFANNGALPPDLSLIVKARPAGVDYIFSLLTGYGRPPPAGIKVREGMSYNPYFAGALLAMPAPLVDGQVEYEDGTPATVSQMAKDVSVFLAWCAEPEADERKKFGLQTMVALTGALVFAAYYKRWKWNLIKTRRISWIPGAGPKH